MVRREAATFVIVGSIPTSDFVIRRSYNGITFVSKAKDVGSIPTRRVIRLWCNGATRFRACTYLRGRRSIRLNRVMSKIVDLFTGGKMPVYHRGVAFDEKTLDEVLAETDAQFESCHDVIQWLFPLHEKSLHSLTSPVLSPEDVKFVQSSADAKQSMLKCLDRMCKILGIGKHVDFVKQRSWCNTGNHNLLRVTRVIRSLRLFGLDDEAKKFHAEVMELGKGRLIPKVTLDFWNKALNDPIDASLTDKFLKMRMIKVN